MNRQRSIITSKKQPKEFLNIRLSSPDVTENKKKKHISSSNSSVPKRKKKN